MANTIKLKRSAVPGKVPTVGDLQLGELGLNTYDGKLYTKKNNGSDTIVEIGGFGSPGGSTTQVQYNNAGAFAGDSNFVFDNTTDTLSVQRLQLNAGTGASAAIAIGSLTGNTFGLGAYGLIEATNGPSIRMTTGSAYIEARNDGLADGIHIFGPLIFDYTASIESTGGIQALPSGTGTLVSTSSSAAVTGSMIAADTITNANVSPTAAIAGSKISPTFGAQTISSSATQGLDLTGAINAGATNKGILTVGQLGFTGARLAASFQSSQTQYFQAILQNTNGGSNASCDFVVCNDISTDTANYGNFGINSSAYTGTGVFNAPNAVYLTSTGGDLGIGTLTANDVRFTYNAEATDALRLGAADATFGKVIKPRTGTATAAPLVFTAGTNLTTAAAGAVEYDGTHAYITNTTGLGRGQLGVFQTFRLTSNGTNVGPTIGDFFGTASTISLAATSVYEITFFAYLQKNTANTLTWTLTASSAPTLISATYEAGPVTGIAAGAITSGYAGSRGATTAAFAATASITNNAFMVYTITARVVTNLATTFRLQVTNGSGTVTPQAGSYYTVRQVAGTTGAFA